MRCCLFAPAPRLRWRALGCLALLLGLLACSAAGGSAPGAPLPGSLAGGQPKGLFFFLNVFNRQGRYYFTPDGRVYADPTDFTPAGLAAVSPRSRGAFEVSGEEMTVTWDEGGPETHRYKYDPTGFEWNGSFVGVGPFAAAGQLVGTFEGHADAVAVDANTTTVYRTLAFRPDGSFTRDNYAAAHLDACPSTGADPGAGPGTVTDAAAAARQTGRWVLDGWFLTLAAAAGPPQRGVAYPLETDDKTGQVTRFCFGGVVFKRQ